MPPENLQLDLGEAERRAGVIKLGSRAAVLPGFARDRAPALIEASLTSVIPSPFRHMVTPGGFEMSVALTNCGTAGWVTDRTGYRYDSIDPQTHRPWPAMPRIFADLATEAAAVVGFDDFQPDACLINRYAPGSRLSLHQDRNERDFKEPIVSVSLGLPAIFLWGGQKRSDRPTHVQLVHGDVVVWGGPDRLVFHGVNRLPEGRHPLTGGVRYNLTFRKAL